MSKRFITLALFAVMFAWSDTSHDWWFEDDPLLYSEAAMRTPMDFLFDKAIIVHGSGNEIVPELFASFWLDNRIAPGSVEFAYWHSALAVLVAALLLQTLVGSLVAWAWLLLPSTLATLEFLSTRCYVEGLIFALLALFCARRVVRGENPLWLVLCLANAAAAMFSKELFVATLPAALVLAFAGAHRWRAIAATTALACVYFAYRAWAVGVSVRYGMELPEARPLLGMLLITLRSLTYGNESYIVAAAILFMAISVYRTRPSARPPMHKMAVLLGLALATLVPVSYALLINFNTPAPWARVFLVFDTLILVSFAWLARRSVIAWALLFAFLSMGAVRSIHDWNERKLLNRLEGEFFFSHPGELLLSANPAPWFFDGLAAIYPTLGHADVISLAMPPETIAAARKLHRREWSLREGQFEAREFLP